MAVLSVGAKEHIVRSRRCGRDHEWKWQNSINNDMAADKTCVSYFHISIKT